MAHFTIRPDAHFNVVPGFGYASVCVTVEELATIPFNVPCTYTVEDLRFDGTACTLDKETRVVGFSVSYVGPAGKFGDRPSRPLHLNLSHTPKEYTMAFFVERPQPIHDGISDAVVQFAPNETYDGVLGVEGVFEIENIRFGGTPIKLSDDATTVRYKVNWVINLPYEDCAKAPVHVPEIMRYFEYAHLPNHLQEISRPLHGIAEHMVNTVPPSAELSAGLRKLLEAKDCFVRAALPPRRDN